MSSGYIHTADPLAPTNATTSAAATAAPPNAQYANAFAHHFQNGQYDVDRKPPATINPAAFAQNTALSSFATSIGGYPLSAQEILKRASETTNISAGSAEWEAARQQVLKNMVGSSHAARVERTTPTGTGRGRGRGGKTASPAVAGARAQPTNGTPTTSQVLHIAPGGTPATDPPVKRGRGRPRGSGVRGAKKARGGGGGGGGRGGRKRKRDEEDEDESLSEPSSSLTPPSSPEATPQTTMTKSGRNVTKPSLFNPLPEPSPDAEHKRKRSYRRGPEFQLCAKCQRGHSPPSNVIVFCDGCNAAYHQWCHDPMIPRDVVDVAEKEWFCMKCVNRKEMEDLPLDKRVGGQPLLVDEKRAYLSSLSLPTLVTLLLHSTTLHPDLPIYPPPPPTTNTIQPRHSHSSNTHSTTTNGASSHSHPTSTYPDLSTPSNIPLHHAPASPDSTPYPDYSNPSNDPPATYPRPGHGPIKLRPLTDPEDMQWLIDDNTDVFSHLVSDGSGGLVTVGAVGVGRERGWAEMAVGAQDDGTGNATGKVEVGGRSVGRERSGDGQEVFESAEEEVGDDEDVAHHGDGDAFNGALDPGLDADGDGDMNMDVDVFSELRGETEMQMG